MRDRLRSLANALSPAEKIFVLFVLMFACQGCQAGFWKSAGDNAGKGGLVSALGTLGSIYGGPVGAFGGSMLGYFFVEVVQGDLEMEAVQVNLWSIAGAQEAITQTTSPMLDQLWDKVVNFVLLLFGGWLAFYFLKQWWWEKRHTKKLDERFNGT